MPIQEASYDLLIIGGGPGGSCAAALARQKNLRVLVVEKCAFPRFRIGESLLPMANSILRETGVWEKIESAGFMPKLGAEFHTADGSESKHLIFSEGYVPNLDRAFQVERARFDTLLLDHARELGAEVRMETNVIAVESTPDTNRVTLVNASNESYTVTVPWVIDSTGRETNLTSEQKRTLDPSPFPKRMAIYSHFHGVNRNSWRNPGNIVVVRIENGWFWFIPLDQHRTSVGLVTTVEAFRQRAIPPEKFFQDTVSHAPKLRQLLANATPTMEFRVTTDYSYFRTELARERLILVGDAAGFFDPIFSSGVYMAMYSARNAVELIARAHQAKRTLSVRERNRYKSTIKRHAGVFQKLIGAFYDNDAFAVFMSQKVPWGMASGLTSIVAGHARLTWPR